ncbi:MAG: TlpA disulfide reductase family protein [Bacteroidetes bacterium]|nr:TlpA disulfide reductase family protein [Bacteroidota bacterium]
MIRYLLIVFSFVLLLSSCKNGGDSTSESTGKDSSSTKRDSVLESKYIHKDNPDGTTTILSPNGEVVRIQKTMKEGPFIVEGTIVGGKGFNIILDRLEVGTYQPLFDQDLNNEGKFRFEMDAKGPELMRLRLPKGVLDFVVKPGEHLTFTADFNKPMENFKIEGAYEAEFVMEMYRVLDITNNKIEDVETLQDNIKDHKILNLMNDTLPAYWEKLNIEKTANLKRFITRIDTAYTALLAAARLDCEKNIEFIEAVDKKFSKLYPNTPAYKALHEKVIVYAPVALGRIAPEIMGNDAKGTSIRLSSTKGKYTLIQFWGNWQDDALNQLPELKRIYNKYHSNGFEILSVNLDDDRSQWVSAVEDYKAAGIMINDPGKFGAASAQTYMISDIPRLYLLDKDGRFIYKHFTPAELDKKLSMLMGGKK